MTSVLLATSFLNYVMCTLMFLTALFLVLLVLVQRGRGGGLTGALGGMGGQSAFGTKAGDMFTKVTMITAGVWIVLCMLTIKLFSSQDPWAGISDSKTRVTGPAEPGKEKPAAESDSATTEGTATDAASKGAATPVDAAAPSAPAAVEKPEAADESKTPAKE